MLKCILVHARIHSVPALDMQARTERFPLAIIQSQMAANSCKLGFANHMNLQ
jgi:hypothetical protein